MKILSALILIFAFSGCQTYESETGCRPRCKDRVCGDDGCGGSCGECQTYQLCQEGACVDPPCCEDAPAGEIHISVTGKVLDLITRQGVRVALRPVSPMDALTNPDPECISCGDRWESDEDGNFYIPCHDVTEMALGCVILVDDLHYDGTGGAYFPTGIGVKSWNNNSEKRCVYDAKAFAVPNTLVSTLDANTSADSAGFGFVVGLVADAENHPQEGAVIKMSDGNDLVEVIYPDETFTAFDGKSTSTSGIFVLPHTNFAGGITEIVAEKEGMTFGAEKAAPKAGFCYFVYIRAN